MAKKTPQEKLYSIINRLAKKFWPDDILHELSVLYEENSAQAYTNSEAESDFWLKCARACRNLSSGMEKWQDEMKDEQEDGEED